MSAVLAIICAVLVVGVDQLSKYLVTVHMAINEDIAVIPGLIDFNRIEPNEGAAFGMFQGQTWPLIAVTLLIMIVCIGMLIRHTFDSKLMFWALCIVLGGGMGNLIDRVFRGGGVIDFIEFSFFDFPVFNVADIAVCVGAGLIMLYFVLDLIKDFRNKRRGITSINAEDDSVIERENANVGKQNDDE